MDPRAFRIAQEFLRAHLRYAKYAPEFLQWVEGKRFPNPNPEGRLPDVVFGTLPDEEQQKIYEQWSKSTGSEEDEDEADKTPEDPKEITRRNLDIARHGKVVSSRVISEGMAAGGAGPVNQSSVVKLEHDGQTQLFIHKPAEGEMKNLRWGIRGGTYHSREQATYGIDRLLGGRGIVPATITRGNEEGSYQLWARGAQQFNSTGIGELAKHVTPEDLQRSPDFHRMNVLDLITGHEDRHRGNLMYYFEEGQDPSPESLRLVAIDNGLTLARPMPLPEHHVYVHPFNGLYQEDESQNSAAQDKVADEYRTRGNAAVAKSLSNIDPKLHEQIKDIDLAEAAKAISDSGVNEEEAVRAALERIAAIQQDPRIFRDILQEVGGNLDKAWRTFQHLSGKEGELLVRAGASHREEDIRRAVQSARPTGGWRQEQIDRIEAEAAAAEKKRLQEWGAQDADAGTKRDAPADAGTKKKAPVDPLEQVPWDEDAERKRVEEWKRKHEPVESKDEPQYEDDWGDIMDDDEPAKKTARQVRDRWLRSILGARMKNTLTVSSMDSRTMKPHVLAVFTLKEGKVEANYKDNRFRQDIRHHGARLMGKAYHPEDGAKFMAALENAYRTSSFMSVVRS